MSARPALSCFHAFFFAFIRELFEESLSYSSELSWSRMINLIFRPFDFVVEILPGKLNFYCNCPMSTIKLLKFKVYFRYKSKQKMARNALQNQIAHLRLH